MNDKFERLKKLEIEIREYDDLINSSQTIKNPVNSLLRIFRKERESTYYGLGCTYYGMIERCVLDNLSKDQQDEVLNLVKKWRGDAQKEFDYLLKDI